METKKIIRNPTEGGDHLISFDIREGYRHLNLHEDVRNSFLFHCDGRFYRCKALPFERRRSSFRFVNLHKPLVNCMRTEMGVRMFPNIDDFLLRLQWDE